MSPAASWLYPSPLLSGLTATAVFLTAAVGWAAQETTERIDLMTCTACGGTCYPQGNLWVCSCGATFAR